MSTTLFLRRYQDGVLIALTVLFLAAIITFFVVGTRELVVDLGTAITSERSTAAIVNFRLNDAKKILADHGLVR